LEWWCEQYPTAVSAHTTHTQELPLHCYLASKGREEGSRETAINIPPKQPYDNDDLYFLAVQFMAEQHPNALNCANQKGWSLLHVAALQDAPLDMVYYLLCQNLGALLPTIVVFAGLP